MMSISSFGVAIPRLLFFWKQCRTNTASANLKEKGPGSDSHEDIRIQQLRHGVSILPGKRRGVCVRRRFELDAALGPAGPEDIGSATRPVGDETRNDPATASDRNLLAFFDGGE
jgi:hypothetical protein